MGRNLSYNSTIHCFPNWLRYFGLFCCIIRLLICVIGIVGNSLSVTIFLKERFRQLSINIFLSALSITDLCQQFLAVPVFASGPLMLFWCRWEFIQKVYSFSTVYLYPTVMIFHFCSIWMLIAISFERWVAVCKPLLSITYCTRKRAMIIIILIMAFSISYNLIRFWEFHLNNSYSAIPNLRKNSDYQLWYGVISYLVVMYLLPLIVMANFNIGIIMELWRTFNRRKTMSARQKENRKTARMLLWLVCSFICCYTPSYILKVIEPLHRNFFSTYLGFATCDLNNVLSALNGATTFLFYLKFSSQYRRAARSIFRHTLQLQRSHSISRTEWQRLHMILNDSPSITASRQTITQPSRIRKKVTFDMRAVTVDRSSPTQIVTYSCPEGLKDHQMVVNSNTPLIHMKRRASSSNDLFSNYEVVEFQI